MFTTWLRNNRVAAVLLTIVRVYLGYEFLSAGWEKLSASTPFDASGFLKYSMSNPVLSPTKAVEYPWFNSFITGFAIPHVAVFNVLVPWGEFLIGVGLILGILTTTAGFFAMMLNFMYMFCGTISSNPLDVLLGIFIVVAGYNAGRIGGDFFIIPRLRDGVHKLFHRESPLAGLPRSAHSH